VVILSGNGKWRANASFAFAQISIGNCVCTNLKWQLRLRKFQMAIAFAKSQMAIGNRYFESLVNQNTIS